MAKYLGILFWISGICLAISQERFVDDVFSKISVKTHTYSDTLKLDFYSPKKDTLNKKPILILVHGGGFGSGKRDNLLEKRFCKEMAQKGYAVASISYRLTRKGKSFGCDCPAGEKLKTFRSVSEDILKAVQYLADKERPLGIDTEKIVLVGSSAGAEAVLNTVFMQHEETYKTLPYGNIEFAGVVSLVGAVVDARYINTGNAVPTMLFHGQKDRLVPYATASHHYCSSEKSGYLILDGSAAIVQRLEKIGTSYQLMYDTGGNHNWANLSYRYTDAVAQFIQRAVLKKQLIQSKIKIDK